MMDYSLLLGVHYPSRNYTRASLEAAPSLSLDGTLIMPGCGAAANCNPWSQAAPASSQTGSADCRAWQSMHMYR